MLTTMKEMDDSQILLDSFRSAQLLCDGTREDLHKWWRHEYDLMLREFVTKKLNKIKDGLLELDLALRNQIE
jgi:hypothetical protein